MIEKAIMEALMSGLVSAGLPCLLLAVGLWWMNKFMGKQISVSESKQTEFITALNKERSERLDAMDKQNAACEEDRKELRGQLIGLLKEDRTVVRTIDTTKVPIITHDHQVTQSAH